MKGLIFDLDGTLVNSLEDLADSVNTVLKNRGYPTFPTEDFKLFIGNGMAKLIERVLPEGGVTEENVVSVCTEFVSYYNAHCMVKTRPYPGITDLLAKLKSDGFKLLVISNKPDVQTKRIISALFPADTFDAVSGNLEGYPTKPDPTRILELIAEVGLTGKDCFFVGDSGVDVMTAANCGAVSVGVTWGFRSKKELTEHNAKYIVNTADEIYVLAADSTPNPAP